MMKNHAKELRGKADEEVFKAVFGADLIDDEDVSMEDFEKEIAEEEAAVAKGDTDAIKSKPPPKSFKTSNPALGHTSAPHRQDEIRSLAKTIRCDTCVAGLETLFAALVQSKSSLGAWHQTQMTLEEHLITTMEEMCLDAAKGHIYSAINPFRMHFVLFAENATDALDFAVLGNPARRAALVRNRKPKKRLMMDAFYESGEIAGAAVRLACTAVISENSVEMGESMFGFLKGKISSSGSMPSLELWETKLIPNICADQLHICSLSELQKLRAYSAGGLRKDEAVTVTDEL
jgi:hypothetical protein